MTLNLTQAQIKKLEAILDCFDIEDLHKFHTLVAHAENIDEVMRTVDSLSRVGGLFRKIILYTAGLVIAISAISGHLLAWIKAFLKALIIVGK